MRKWIMTVVFIILIIMSVAFGATAWEEVVDFFHSLKLDDSMSKEEISVMVNENKSGLDEVVGIVSKLEQEQVQSIENELIDKLKLKRKISDIFKSENIKNEMEYIEFFCGGKGWDNYCGFYYSPNDLPLIMGGKAEDLRPSGDGWYSDANDVENYTERIAENYFYYEKTFK